MKTLFIKVVFCIVALCSLQLVYAQPGLYQVTHETEGVLDFVWSPNGNQLAFIALSNDTSRLFLIDADGSNKTLLTNTVAYDQMDWKGSVITFRSRIGTGTYDEVIKRIAPDGSDETTIVGPHWLRHPILREDTNWLLYRRAPDGFWRAMRCDLDGGNVLEVSHSSIVQRVGWFGNDHIIYSRGGNIWTTCGIHKVDFDGGNHIQLTPETLPPGATFIASPDTSKILYCDGTASVWDIWIMDADGSNKTQLTNGAFHDYLSNTRDNIWSPNGQSFFFVSNSSGIGDIYRLYIDGSHLIQVTSHDSLDYVPIPSPDGRNLAFISKRDGVSNIWMLTGIQSPWIKEIVDIPNDQGKQVRVSWFQSGFDGVRGSLNVLEYSLWRRIDPLPEYLNLAGSANPEDFRSGGETEMDVTEAPKDFADFLQSLPPGDWDYITTVPAIGSETYHVVAPTLADSNLVNGMHWSVFAVIAHTADPLLNFVSLPDSGYSLDNLAPQAPQGFIAVAGENTINLSWEMVPDSDFNYYALYRSTQSGFDPDTLNPHATMIDTFYVDLQIDPNIQYFYRVSAFDFSGNEGEYSTEANAIVVGVTDGHSSLPREYALFQNYPNPFNPITFIKYAIPEQVDVEIVIYNTFGQKIKTLLSQNQEPGYHIVAWDARNDFGKQVSSGVYFYQIRAGNYSTIKKMVLLK